MSEIPSNPKHSMKDTSNEGAHLLSPPVSSLQCSHSAIPGTEQLMGISAHYIDAGHPSESISSTPLTFLSSLSHPRVFNLRNKPILAAILMGSDGTSSWDQLRGFSHRDEVVCAVSSTHSFPKPESSRQSKVLSLVKY